MAIISFIIFGVVKYFGYYYYLKAIAPTQNPPNLKQVASVRLIAGVVIGASLYFIFKEVTDDLLYIYLTAIFAGRIVIWYLLFHHYYKMFEFKKRVKVVAGGTIISYLLDLPAALGLITIIGGIC